MKRFGTFTGNYPENMSAWRKVGEQLSWVLLKKSPIGKKEDTVWEQYKLISNKKQLKANYWLAFHPVERRLTGRDALLLRENSPTLYRWVINIIEENA